MIERKRYIDRAKALAIFFVVFGHIVLFSLHGEGTCLEFIKDVIYVFHMPLFIFLSGFVVKDSIPLSSILYDCYKRIRQLLVPLIVWGVAITAITDNTVSSLFLSDGKNGYWYLFVLFELYIIHYMYIYVKSVFSCNKYQEILVVFVFASILKLLFFIVPEKVAVPLNMYRLQLYFPFWACGMLVSKYGVVSSILSRPLARYISAIAFCICVYLKFQKVVLPGEIYIISFTAISWILSMLLIIDKYSSFTWAILDRVGQQTLGIYILHYFLVFPLSLNIHSMNSLNSILFCFVVSLFVIVLSLYINKFLNLYKPLYRLLFYK